MKILVTGAAGFVGAAVSKQLVKRGDSVLGVDNMSPYYDVGLKKARLEQIRDSKNDFSFFETDISCEKEMHKIFKDFQPEVVINLAAQPGVRYSLENPSAYVKSNLAGFAVILECCRNFNIKNFVFASSSSVYGGNSQMPYSPHHSTEHPLSLYAATKKSNEMMAHSYSHLFGLACTGLRFFTVYGPWGRPDMAVYSFTRKIVEGQKIEVFNNGHHYRDFTFIDDIVSGVVKVADQPPVSNPLWSSKTPDPATSPAPYKIYNIGNHQPVLLSDFIDTLQEVIGKKADLVMKDLQPGDVLDTYADVEDLMLDFEYRPHTPLKEGLIQFYNWYCEYHNN